MHNGKCPIHTGNYVFTCTECVGEQASEIADLEILNDKAAEKYNTVVTLTGADIPSLTIVSCRLDALAEVLLDTDRLRMRFEKLYASKVNVEIETAYQNLFPNGHNLSENGL